MLDQQEMMRPIGSPSGCDDGLLTRSLELESINVRQATKVLDPQRDGRGVHSGISG